LVKLPFVKSDESRESSMITIRDKNRLDGHPSFQIWRVLDEDCLYMAGFIYTRDPTSLKLNKKMYEGNYIIEMWHGCDQVNLDTQI
jgi:hypothetical protein